jgi:hypothetical protein
MLKPDHIRRRPMCARVLGSWLGWRGRGSGGSDDGGVFAVGVPREAVVVGMKRYGCHDRLLVIEVAIVFSSFTSGECPKSQN